MAIWPSVCSGSSRRSASQIVRRFHVAETRGDVDDPVLGVAEGVDLHSLGVGYARHWQRLDGHDDHVLVAHVVVFDVGAHREWGGLLAAVEEYRRAGNSRQWWVVVGELVDELA